MKKRLIFAAILLFGLTFSSVGYKTFAEIDYKLRPNIVDINGQVHKDRLSILTYIPKNNYNNRSDWNLYYFSIPCVFNKYSNDNKPTEEMEEMSELLKTACGVDFDKIKRDAVNNFKKIEATNLKVKAVRKDGGEVGKVCCEADVSLQSFASNSSSFYFEMDADKLPDGIYDFDIYDKSDNFIGKFRDFELKKQHYDGAEQTWVADPTGNKYGGDLVMVDYEGKPGEHYNTKINLMSFSDDIKSVLYGHGNIKINFCDPQNEDVKFTKTATVVENNKSSDDSTGECKNSECLLKQAKVHTLGTISKEELPHGSEYLLKLYDETNNEFLGTYKLDLKSCCEVR